MYCTSQQTDTAQYNNNHINRSRSPSLTAFDCDIYIYLDSKAFMSIIYTYLQTTEAFVL